MTGSPPITDDKRLFLICGEDEHSARGELSRLKAIVGGGDTSGLSVIEYDAKGLNPDDLCMTCNTVPFLVERRLVIVHGLYAHLHSRKPRRGGTDEAPAPEGSVEAAEAGEADEAPAGVPGKEFERKLAPLLADLPGFTCLVFSEPGLKAADLRQGRYFVWQATIKASGYAATLEFALPRGAELERWIREQVREKGGSISPVAAQALAAFVGANLFALDNELDKLVAYAGPGGTVDQQAVDLLVSEMQETRIFDLIDAVASGRRADAVTLLRRMAAEGTAAAMLRAMLVRRFRELLLAKEILDTPGGAPTTLTQELKVHPFVAEKLGRQVRGFGRIEQIEDVYRRLIETDRQVKKGVDESTALELLVIELAGSSRGGR